MYKRIVLKLSGEALAGEKKGVIFDDSIIWGLIAQIKAVLQMRSVRTASRHSYRHPSSSAQ